MPLRRVLITVLSILLCALGSAAQVGTKKSSAQLTDGNQPDTATRLLEENNYFKALRVDIPAGAKAAVVNPSRDAVLLPLRENLILSVTNSPEGAQLKEGEARFLSRASSARIANSGGEAAQLLVVELKQHWDVEVRACSEQNKCTRPILIGNTPIGETASLFTNGFVTAYRHRLDPGGMLSSSYFSAKGKDHLLLVALTDLHATFDGAEETLKAGQTYGSDATGIEVNAGDTKARWVVIRVLIPKK